MSAEDVVIVGAGPTGLMLACELTLMGVRPVVLDRLTEPSPTPKANGLMGQIVQSLDHRDLLDAFTTEGSFAGADSADVLAAAQPWRDRITMLSANCDDPPAPALLVRPDGYVAWTADTRADLPTAMSVWFGR